MVKTLKVCFSGTKRPMTLSLKVGMQHRVLEYYHVYSNYDSGSNLVPYAFVWEKGRMPGYFPENIVAYDIKVGRCSQLNEYMNLY